MKGYRLTQFRRKGPRTRQISKGSFLMLKALVKFQAARGDERGATAVEYGLMVALIAVFIIGAVQALGTSLDAVFNNIATTIGGVV